MRTYDNNVIGTKSRGVFDWDVAHSLDKRPILQCGACSPN